MKDRSRTMPVIILLGKLLSPFVVLSSTLAENIRDTPGGVEALLREGDYLTAETLARRTLEQAEARYGHDTPETADAMDLLVKVLHLEVKGTHPEALALARRAVSIKERTLAVDDPRLATSLQGLGLVLRDAGFIEDARSVLERDLEIRETRLGTDSPAVAETLTALGSVLKLSEDYAAARSLLERGLDIREKSLGLDHPDVAETLLELGWLAYAHNEAAQKPLFERALEIREKEFGTDHPLVAEALRGLALGLANHGGGDPIPLLRRAMDIQEKRLGRGHPAYATGLADLSVVLWSKGYNLEAEKNLRASVAILEDSLGPENPALTGVLNQFGVVLEWSGSLTEAKSAYERCQNILDGTPGLPRSDAHACTFNLSSTLVGLGAYEEAEPLVRRAIASGEQKHGEDSIDVAYTLPYLGELLEAEGRYDEARRIYERMLSICEKVVGPDGGDTVLALQWLINFSRQTGDYEEAERLGRRALAIEERRTGEPQDALGLAETLRLSGSLEEAKRLAESALRLREERSGGEGIGVAYALETLSLILEAQGHGDQAAPLFARAVEIFQKNLGPDSPRVAWAHRRRAILLLRNSRAGEALGHAARAARIGWEHSRLAARSLTESLALRYSAGRIPDLDLCLSAAADDFTPASARVAWDALVHSRALVLDQMATRHRIAWSTPEIAPLARRLSIASERLANLLVRVPGGNPKAWQEGLDQARDERLRAEAALAEASAAFREDLLREEAGFTDISRALPSDAALVGYVRYERLLHDGDGTMSRPVRRPKTRKPLSSFMAVILGPGDAAPRIVRLGTAARIESLIERWREGVSLAGDPDTDRSSRVAGEALRGAIWDPVAVSLHRARNIFVVPDGALNLVNLAALPSRTGGYLVETGPLIHYLTAERDLMTTSRDQATGRGLLALGGPSYDETSLFASFSSPRPGDRLASSPPSRVESAVYRGGRSSCPDFRGMRFGALPASAHEAREVAAVWSGAKTREAASSGGASEAPPIALVGAAASEGAFKANATGRSVLHLATHGFFLGEHCPSALRLTRGVGTVVSAMDAEPPAVVGENPLLQSGLALAGANHRDAAGPGEEDGILTAEEIASLDLSGLEWAVLSACNTGIGEIRAAEGVFGLRRAFQLAGTRTVIMSLWSVEDESTRQWMRELYKARLVRGLNISSCVREADLAILRDRRAKGLSTNPFYWGGFVATGDWQ